MKKFVKLLGITALFAVIGFSMTACDNDTENGDEETVSYPGKVTSYGITPMYEYYFDNSSTVNIKLTISDGYGTKTLQPEENHWFESTHQVLSVTFSPASKVDYEIKGGLIFWDRS